MLFEKFMFKVNGNENDGKTLEEDPLMLDEDLDQYDPYKFPINDPLENMFHSQNYYLMLTFGNNYNPTMGT
jgi:hypothetical protein